MNFQYWLDNLDDIIVPHIHQGLSKLYNQVRQLTDRVKLKNGNGRTLMAFQLSLTRIKDLSNTALRQDYDYLLKTMSTQGFDEEWLSELLKKTLLCYVTDALRSQGIKIEITVDHLEIPTNLDFVHKTYLNAARTFYRKPHLFYHQYDSLTIQKNIDEIIEEIKKAVAKTVRDHAGLDQIFKKHDLSSVKPKRAYDIRDQFDIQRSILDEGDDEYDSDASADADAESEFVDNELTSQNIRKLEKNLARNNVIDVATQLLESNPTDDHESGQHTASAPLAPTEHEHEHEHDHEPQPSVHESQPLPSTHEHEPLPSTHEHEPLPSVHESQPLPSAHEHEPQPSAHSQPSVHEHDPLPSDHEHEPLPSDHSEHEHEPLPSAHSEHEHEPLPSAHSQLSVHEHQPSDHSEHEHEPMPSVHKHEPQPSDHSEHEHEPLPSVHEHEPQPSDHSEYEHGPLPSAHSEPLPSAHEHEPLPSAHSEHEPTLEMQSEHIPQQSVDSEHQESMHNESASLPEQTESVPETTDLTKDDEDEIINEYLEMAVKNHQQDTISLDENIMLNPRSKKTKITLNKENTETIDIAYNGSESNNKTQNTNSSKIKPQINVIIKENNTTETLDELLSQLRTKKYQQVENLSE